MAYHNPKELRRAKHQQTHFVHRAHSPRVFGQKHVEECGAEVKGKAHRVRPIDELTVSSSR